MNQIIRYPNIKFDLFQVYDKYHVVMYTTIRIKHTDGLWYRTVVGENGIYSDLADVQHSVRSFNQNLYLHQKFGKVLPNTENHMGCKLYVLDSDQREEEERLKAEYLLHFPQREPLDRT